MLKNIETTSPTTPESIPDAPDGMMLENDSVMREPRHGILNPQPNLDTHTAAHAAANVGDMVNTYNISLGCSTNAVRRRTGSRSRLSRLAR